MVFCGPRLLKTIANLRSDTSHYQQQSFFFLSKMANAEPHVIQDVTRRGRQYITYSDGTQWTRKIDPQTGKPLEELRQPESVPQAKPEPLQLHVVTELQAEGEPKHWSLHAARTDANGTTRGQRWQVTGDAEQMRYEQAESINFFNSDSFSWHQTLNSDLSDSDYAKVDQVARSEPPPQAKSRKEVKENCQGWTIRVLGRLVSEGIVNKDTVVNLQEQMDPIN